MNDQNLMIIFGLFFLVSICFYVIIFMLLLRISGRLQELTEQKPTGKPGIDQNRKFKNRQDPAENRLDNRLRNAEKEQEKARSSMRRAHGGKGKSGHGGKKSGDRFRDRNDHSRRSGRNAGSSQGGRDSRRSNQESPRPAPAPKAEASPAIPIVPESPNENAPAGAPESPGNEIRHGRRVQIKRRGFSGGEDQPEEPASTPAAPPETPQPAQESQPVAESGQPVENATG